MKVNKKLLKVVFDILKYAVVAIISYITGSCV